MKIAIFFIAAITAFLISGINPAIVFSNLIYHKDIRNEGSGNPGFTNFWRTFGGKFAIPVLILDVSKALVLEIIFGALFDHILGNRALGIVFTGFFAMLGHAYPVWYKFKGGKAFLVCITTLFMLNWKAGLIALLFLVVILLSFHYMSLASILCLIAGTTSLFFFRTNYIIIILMYLCTAFTTFRHKENIKRLITGTEKKFYFKHHKDDSETEVKEDSKNNAESSESDSNAIKQNKAGENQQ